MPINLPALKSELTTDPIGRGYAALDDEAAAKTFAILDRQPNRETLDGGTLVASIVRAEYNVLLATDKDYLRLIALAQSIPLTATVKAELGALFPAGSTTRANLTALQKRTGNRADELNLGGVPTSSDVADARRLP